MRPPVYVRMRPLLLRAKQEIGHLADVPRSWCCHDPGAAAEALLPRSSSRRSDHGSPCRNRVSVRDDSPPVPAGRSEPKSPDRSSRGDQSTHASRGEGAARVRLSPAGAWIPNPGLIPHRVTACYGDYRIRNRVCQVRSLCENDGSSLGTGIGALRPLVRRNPCEHGPNAFADSGADF